MQSFQRALNYVQTEAFKQKVLKYAQTEAFKTNFKIWGGFLTTLSLLIWQLGGNMNPFQDYIFLQALSSFISNFSFLVIAVKIECNKTVKGVSLMMMECCVLIHMCRLSAIVPFEGYLLSQDPSHHRHYQLCEAMGLCLASLNVYLCRFRYKATYDPEMDPLKNVWLIAFAFAMSLILHSNLNTHEVLYQMPGGSQMLWENIAWASDVAWAFSLYLESLAVLCQFFMFNKVKVVQTHTVHFIAAQALAKLIYFSSFVFEICPFLNTVGSYHPIKKHVGTWMVVMQLASLLVVADFVYHYLRCVIQGISVENIMRKKSSCGC